MYVRSRLPALTNRLNNHDPRVCRFPSMRNPRGSPLRDFVTLQVTLWPQYTRLPEMSPEPFCQQTHHARSRLETTPNDCRVRPSDGRVRFRLLKRQGGTEAFLKKSFDLPPRDLLRSRHRNLSKYKVRYEIGGWVLCTLAVYGTPSCCLGFVRKTQKIKYVFQMTRPFKRQTLTPRTDRPIHKLLVWSHFVGVGSIGRCYTMSCNAALITFLVYEL